MIEPYYQDDLVTLYHAPYQGEVMPILMNAGADVVVTDPPYGETALEWDRWPKFWPDDARTFAKSLWCFGSFRMFYDNAAQFSAWKFSHEIVWEKQNGTGFATDKFRRVHELATLWYQGDWAGVRHEVPRVEQESIGNKSSRLRGQTPHAGAIGQLGYVDDGSRMMKSVQFVQNEQSRAVHPTQKPLGIVAPLIEYSCPPGGLVIDMFAGSGTTLLAARNAGRKAIGTEVNEAYCEAAAMRLSQQAFNFEEIA